jgi:tRNA threonylcarbamoyl adenosine modification protein YeaZ
MKVLALELSTARGSVAWNDDVSSEEQDWPNDRKNSAAFFESVKAMLARHGAPELIIVGLGPGSYAGTRIAISTAIGLHAASQARLIGLPSICAMPEKKRDYYVVGDARRQMFFLARIEDRALFGEPELLSEMDLRAALDRLGGDAAVISSDRLPQFSRVVSSFPSALLLAELAQDMNRSFSLPPLQPIYLREPHITEPKKNAHYLIP